MLEGFERVGTRKGTPKMTITDTGLLFNDKAKTLMRDSCFVFLINRESRKVALQRTIENDRDAIHSKRIQRIFTNRGIREAIKEMMGWDMENHYYKASGVYDEKEEAIIFNLKTAVEKQKITRREK